MPSSFVKFSPPGPALGAAAKIKGTVMDHYKIDAPATRELTLDEIDNVAGGATFAPVPYNPPPPHLPIQWDNLPAAPPVLY